MSAPGYEISLSTGSDSALPAPVMRSFKKAVVTQGETSPQSFQIQFSDDYSLSEFQDIPVVKANELGIGERIKIHARVNATKRTLIYGVITRVTYTPPGKDDGGHYTIEGEDISYFMDLIDVTRTYPFTIDFAMVGVILAPYCATFSMIPDIKESLSGIVDLLTTPTQNGTDRQIVQQLAAAHNFIFCIRHEGSSSTPKAYWGKRPYDDAPQAPLVAAYAGGGNIKSLQFSFDGTSSQRHWGIFENKETEIIIPFATVTSLSGIDYAARPALTSSAAITAKNKLFCQGGKNIPQSMAQMQNRTDASTEAVVTGQGKLDAFSYGSILVAPGVVELAGAGATYDGMYYVSQVTHHVTRESYEQDFTLSREGIGTTLQSVGAAS